MKLFQLTCLNNSLSITPCAATNQTCLCADEQYSTAVQTCVTQTCTVKEQLGGFSCVYARYCEPTEGP